MKQNLVLVFLLLLLSISCAKQEKKINGISFVASRDSIRDIHVAPVVKTNASHVALMPFGFVRELNNPEIVFNSKRQWFGETKKGVEFEASQFKKSSIESMVKPQLWISRGVFTGAIQLKSDAEWELFEKSYEQFILTYAAAAESAKASMFCIGTELEKFVLARPLFWSQLIAKVRKIYSGKLTYAANWDEYKRVPFWKDLDFIGIDAYFPLTDKQTPTVLDFEKGWATHKNEIARLQRQIGKPVLFTEYGYRSVDYTGDKPWESDRIAGKVNIEAQQNALQAIHNQFWNESWFAGGFLWKWFHEHERAGGEKNNRFTPQNKATEKLLEQLYLQKKG
ncbi:hypothetical protein GCM10011416_11290 [Polaribacter pacificus]|uniref:GTA TIM-barrel-like domain-containing protein n=1 Tax=Polaribacter pacificus TaxID=1775173 RepID=A0A917HZ40_9FLAO|nr:glycoside hydrolase TIM-barrel-like domain-containing protein [Polaribacter pacificus]GGG95482.1 hypothetical protein GCM10011416_11290 [Polaribacter pacificus]